MTLVAGVDSSTQSCKVSVRDADTGHLVRFGSAKHPEGTEVHPNAWWDALRSALDAAGGWDDVSAVAIAAQQHGMVCLDEDGVVVREALLWNDLRSATAAAELIDALPGGVAAWAQACGSVPQASFTVTKLRWLSEHEPANARRTAAVCLPHDWLTWRLRGARDVDALTTDRGDASGTGYWSPRNNAYRADLLHLAMGREPVVPKVLGPSQAAGMTSAGILLGAGTGDNAAAALGLGAEAGDVIVSVGTSGVVSTVAHEPTADATGVVAGFADATGAYLPLVCTMNAARVLTATATLLGVTLDELSRLALGAPPGAEGLVFVPYLEGERTPNRPDASGSLHGMTVANATPANMARAAIEGLLCGLAAGLDALRAEGCEVGRVILIGGGAQSAAVRGLAPAVLAMPVHVPRTGEYVADGAARQAAWTLADTGRPPVWAGIGAPVVYRAEPVPWLRERYTAVASVAGYTEQSAGAARR